MNELFWMIWIEGKGGSTVQHFELDEARLEAERLLKLPGNEGRKAYILRANCYGVIESPITWRTI